MNIVKGVVLLFLIFNIQFIFGQEVSDSCNVNFWVFEGTSENQKYIREDSCKISNQVFPDTDIKLICKLLLLNQGTIHQAFNSNWFSKQIKYFSKRTLSIDDYDYQVVPYVACDGTYRIWFNAIHKSIDIPLDENIIKAFDGGTSFFSGSFIIESGELVCLYINGI